MLLEVGHSINVSPLVSIQYLVLLPVCVPNGTMSTHFLCQRRLSAIEQTQYYPDSGCNFSSLCVVVCTPTKEILHTSCYGDLRASHWNPSYWVQRKLTHELILMTSMASPGKCLQLGRNRTCIKWELDEALDTLYVFHREHRLMKPLPCLASPPLHEHAVNLHAQYVKQWDVISSSTELHGCFTGQAKSTLIT